jgi:D-aminoacyl-tRNA deacylase
MRIVLQRVLRATVTVDGQRVAQIGRGFLLLVGVGRGDPSDEPERMAEKIVNLRLFSDYQGMTNLPLAGVDGEILVVPQFTLYANLRKGRRPSWGDAEDPEIAALRVEALAEALESHGARVSRGVFGAVMDVELLNEGPFTLILEGRSLSST